jgi:folate-binding Fe-S cluster repair protein YgfZ
MMNPADQMHALRSGCGVLAPPRAFVAVAGPDAESLLQNLLTQDLAGMADGEARRALLLTPKARIASDMRVIRTATGFLLETRDAEGLAALLVRYRLGAKAEIEATGHWSLISLIGPDAPGIALPGVRIASTRPSGRAPSPSRRRRSRRCASRPGSSTPTSAGCPPRPGSSTPPCRSPRAASSDRSR